jgi:hypothetical protein
MELEALLDLRRLVVRTTADTKAYTVFKIAFQEVLLNKIYPEPSDVKYAEITWLGGTAARAMLENKAFAHPDIALRGLQEFTMRGIPPFWVGYVCRAAARESRTPLTS